MLDNPGRPYWNERNLTDESVFWNRRRFLKQMTAAAGGLTFAPAGAGIALGAQTAEDVRYHVPEHKLSESLYPAKVNEAYKDAGRALSPKEDVFTYNNFYEFSLRKDVHEWVDDYQPFPWEIEVTGLCNKPKKWDIDELLKDFALEERTYRFRCVEAWAMTVPWSGFPLSSLLEKCEPASDAKFVKFTSFHRPEQARGQKEFTQYTWPYYEGVHLEEAMNPLAFVATGVFGKQLPKQSGSPIRIIFPWKYGYKGPKAVVRIELTSARPGAFWNDLQANEYGFYSNVDPNRPHPRWSQASERLLGSGRRVPTALYNGYTAELETLHKSLYRDGEVF